MPRGQHSNPGSVVITGGSSGLGAALARAYAAEGTTLFLSGRHAERLHQVADSCRQQGSTVREAVLDVADRDAVRHWVAASDDERPLDLVIANAGISGGTAGDEDEDQVRAILAVNVDGVLNTIHPAIERMSERGRGQIGLMSSLAAFRGLPSAPAYSTSKAAVRVYGEALRPYLAERGIRVSVICPGFVESGMTATNEFPMPMLMPATRAAAVIQRGLARNRGRIAFPFPLYAGAWLSGVLPPAWLDAVLNRLPRKR